MDIDDYHIYATWKPKADSYPPENKVFMKIDVYSKSIVYQNFCQDYVSEEYDLATLKSMRNILINNGYECISEEEILSHYYTTKNDLSIHSEIKYIRISPDISLAIGFNDYAATFSLKIDKNY